MTHARILATAAAVSIGLSAAPLAAQHDSHAMHARQEAPATTVPAAPADESLPPSEERAKPTLVSSPRHGEYVDVKLPGSDQAIRTFVVYPERKDRPPS